MDTKINKTLLSNWGNQIYTNNSSSITELEEFKSLFTSLPAAYSCSSSEAFIDNITKDLNNLVNCHTAMQNLQTFLEKVVANAEEA